MSVFLVVDVQNDFISGTLNISHCSARQNGAEVSKKKKRKQIQFRVLKIISVPRLFFLLGSTGTFLSPVKYKNSTVF
jgi:hypothetical protein